MKIVRLIDGNDIKCHETKLLFTRSMLKCPHPHDLWVMHSQIIGEGEKRSRKSRKVPSPCDAENLTLLYRVSKKSTYQAKVEVDKNTTGSIDKWTIYGNYITFGASS